MFELPAPTTLVGAVRVANIAPAQAQNLAQNPGQQARSRRYSSSDIGSRATSDSDSSDSDNGLYHRHTKVQHRHRKVQ
ncbi:hypothetical protein WJX79_000696 [Trebouxia sp. C0005]